MRRLEQAGINVAEAERKDQLVIRSWDNAYLQDGYFDADRQISLIEELLVDGKARGFELTRLIARMEWALQDRPGVNQIVEYEFRLNQTLQKYDDVVCWHLRPVQVQCLGDHGYSSHASRCAHRRSSTSKRILCFS